MLKATGMERYDRLWEPFIVSIIGVAAIIVSLL